MTKKRNCKYCGEYSAKRKICKRCKELTPYRPSGDKGNPFNREEQIDKLKKKGKIKK